MLLSDGGDVCGMMLRCVCELFVKSMTETLWCCFITSIFVCRRRRWWWEREGQQEWP